MQIQRRVIALIWFVCSFDLPMARPDWQQDLSSAGAAHNASSGGAAPNPTALTLSDDPNELIRNGHLDEAIKRLRERMAANPADQVLRYKLILICLKLHRTTEAAAELQDWSRVTPGSNELRSKLESLIPQVDFDPERELKLRQQLRVSLEGHHADQALALIDQMAIGERGREVLKLEIELYRPDFVGAASHASKIANRGGEEDRRIGHELISEIAESSREYTERNQNLHRFLSSQLSVSSCSPVATRKAVARHNFSLQDYVRTVVISNLRYPLNAHFQDLQFHAALISSLPYGDIEALGDRILNAQGILRIPFYSRDKLFDVVLDRSQRRIYTQSDSTVQANPYGSTDLEGLVPFDLSFDQVREIRQSIETDRALLGVATGSSALSVEPRAGNAPNYVFMHLLQCLYGEEAQRSASRNLVIYIAHVISNPGLKVRLANSKGSSDWATAGSKWLATAGVGTAIVAGFSSGATQNDRSDPATSQLQAVQQQTIANSLSVLETRARELVRQSQLVGSNGDRTALFGMLQTKALPLVDPKMSGVQLRRVDELLQLISAR